MYVDSIVEIKHFINTFSLMWKKLKKLMILSVLNSFKLGERNLMTSLIFCAAILSFILIDFDLLSGRCTLGGIGTKQRIRPKGGCCN